MSAHDSQNPASAQVHFTKQILHEGDKATFPKRGDEVTVVYEGKLTTGKVFDTTQIRGPFRTEIGVNKVIRGWDEAVLEMSLGERCILTIPPEHAYGINGFPPDVIPPNATLVFQMELIGIGGRSVEPKEGLYTEQLPSASTAYPPPNGNPATGRA